MIRAVIHDRHQQVYSSFSLDTCVSWWPETYVVWPSLKSSIIKTMKLIRDGPLEKLWEWGIFDPQEFFSLSNSSYEFFLGHSMNIFLGLIGVHEFFFSFNFLLCEYIFFYTSPPPPPHTFSHGPSLRSICDPFLGCHFSVVWHPIKESKMTLKKNTCAKEELAVQKVKDYELHSPKSIGKFCFCEFISLLSGCSMLRHATLLPSFVGRGGALLDDEWLLTLLAGR